MVAESKIESHILYKRIFQEEFLGDMDIVLQEININRTISQPKDYGVTERDGKSVTRLLILVILDVNFWEVRKPHIHTNLDFLKRLMGFAMDGSLDAPIGDAVDEQEGWVKYYKRIQDVHLSVIRDVHTKNSSMHNDETNHVQNRLIGTFYEQAAENNNLRGEIMQSHAVEVLEHKWRPGRKYAVQHSREASGDEEDNMQSTIQVSLPIPAFKFIFLSRCIGNCWLNNS
ncbi:hypothetical protein SUGI_0248720 [Cryptomeria japonica]|nr:hypothetical protein SUGI_0248720 [Cryptomeria japonica]